METLSLTCNKLSEGDFNSLDESRANKPNGTKNVINLTTPHHTNTLFGSANFPSPPPREKNPSLHTWYRRLIGCQPRVMPSQLVVPNGRERSRLPQSIIINVSRSSTPSIIVPISDAWIRRYLHGIVAVVSRPVRLTIVRDARTNLRRKIPLYGIPRWRLPCNLDFLSFGPQSQENC